MIHHKNENVSNPKNARRHPMVNRWKYQAFVKEAKWMADGLSVRKPLNLMFFSNSKFHRR